MINNTSSIRIDVKKKQLQEDNCHLFHFSANEGDVHRYIASCIPAHWHQELELFFLVSGNVCIGIGDEFHEVKAGEGCFINTGVLHSFTGNTSSPCIFRSFVFDSNIVGGAPGSVFDAVYIRPLLESGISFLKFEKDSGDTTFFQHFDQTFLACVSEKAGYEFQVRSSLSDILFFITQKSRLATSRTLETVQETRIKQMLCWIDENIRADITLKAIADTAGIFPRECQRIFSQYLHRSPMEYLQWKRILAAAEKLASTKEPVTTIALTYGFSSPSYFSKKFKCFVGSTPSEYRALIQKP